ncbi:MAG: hypothetical protein JG766_843 [Desulfacinum sp.]|jgi:hypothetical protein|nr:hypothetical protein [Desulfacinum sp.]
MEYGIRRYESSQRLWWFVFLLLALAGGIPARGVIRTWVEGAGPSGATVSAESVRQAGFWFQLPWVEKGFAGPVLLFLFGVLLSCLVLRFLWLASQTTGAFVVARSLKKHLGALPGRPKPDGDWLLESPERILPVEQLVRTAQRLPFSLLSLAHKRLRLLLSGAQGLPSSDEMMHREQRLEGVDWHLTGASWEPFRWIARFLPLVGLAQSGWVFFLQLQPVIQGTGEMGDVVVVGATSLLAFVQAVAAALVFAVGAGLVTRLESFLLTRLDGLFYDQLLARLPLHNADTLLILKTLRSQFEDLQRGLQRIEQALKSPSR